MKFRTKKISFIIPFDPVLADRIIFFLWRKKGEGENNFLWLYDKLKDYLPGRKGFLKLKLHLLWLEHQGYLEERHFLKPAGLVDYDIENKGIKRALRLSELKTASA